MDVCHFPSPGNGVDNKLQEQSLQVEGSVPWVFVEVQAIKQ